jgi:hypothetical protein
MIMPYANADACLGNKVGRFHRRTWWYARGTPHVQFEAIIAEIKTQVETAIDDYYYGFFHFQLFMIGRDEASAKPTIMFFCEKKEVREKAKKAIDSGGLMQKLPGFRTGHASTQPNIGSLVQRATEDPGTDSTSVSIIHVEVYFDPSKEVRASGMPIYIKHQNGRQRQATAYAVFRGDRCMLMTVAHVFIERTSGSSEVTTDGDSDYNLGSGTESEGEDEEQTEITSRGSTSSRGRDSSDELSTQTSRVSGSSSQPHLADVVAPHAEALGSRLNSMPNTLSSTAGNSDEMDSILVYDLQRLGTVVTSSVNEDWALIDITDANIASTISVQTDSRTSVESSCRMDGLRVVLNVLRGLNIYGTVSKTTSYMRLPGASDFQELYVLQLEQKIDWGDCGAMVMGRSHRKLCGHIVASSRMGRVAFVIPAKRVLYSSDTTWNKTPSVASVYTLASLPISAAPEPNFAPGDSTTSAPDYNWHPIVSSYSPWHPDASYNQQWHPDATYDEEWYPTASYNPQPRMYLGMGGSIGSESDNNYSTTRPSYSETTHTPSEAVDWMDTSSGTSTYQPSVNVYAYDPSMNIHVYEPSVNVHAYEPSVSIYDDQPSLDECSVPGRAFTSYQDNEDEMSNQFAQQQHLAGKF